MEELDLVSRIEDLGLSNKEARVYVACLKLGPAPVQVIADKSGVKRVTAYVILEALQGLGLAKQTQRGKKTYFVGEDPSRLEVILQGRATEVSEQLQNLRLILPELVGLQSVPPDLPEVKIFDDEDKVRAALVDFFTTFSDDPTQFSWVCDWDRLHHLDIDWTGFKLKGRMISSGRKPHTLDTRGLESKFVPSSQLPLSADIGVQGESVLVITTTADGLQVGIRIKNAAFAQSLRACFDLAWSVMLPFNETSALR